MKRVSVNPFLAQNLTSYLERQSTLPEVILPKIKRVIGRVNFHGVPTLLQYWECNPVPGSEENGYSLTVNSQLFLLTKSNNALECYRVKSQKRGHYVVGQETKVNKCLAARAVQTRVADQGTERIDQTDLGILVLPVFVQQRTCKQIVGIFELVMIEPRSYEDHLVHMHKLLIEEGLTSEGMGKIIKVHCDHIIKFPLSCSAKLHDLQKEVRKRLLKKLENKTFSIEYEDTNCKRYQILSDEDLKVCINESVSKETTVIRMFVEPIA